MLNKRNRLSALFTAIGLAGIPVMYYGDSIGINVTVIGVIITAVFMLVALSLLDLTDKENKIEKK